MERSKRERIERLEEEFEHLKREVRRLERLLLKALGYRSVVIRLGVPVNQKPPPQKQEHATQMNFPLGDSQKVQFSILLKDEDGVSTNTVGTGVTLSLKSSDETSLVVQQDSTPNAGTFASGWLVGQAKPQVGVTFTAQLLNPDGTPLGDPAVDTLDIVTGAAVGLAIALGAPVDASPTAPPPPPSTGAPTSQAPSA